MQELIIEKTTKTPSIDFNPGTGMLKMYGISIPEDHRLFYDPVVAWLKEYAKNAADKTVFEVGLEYFNTSTSRVLLNVFNSLEYAHNHGKEVQIIWLYEDGDIDMEEVGEDYKRLVEIPMQLRAVESF